MSTNLVAIDNTTHKNTKVKPNATFENGKNMHLCLMQIHEFIAASSEYPLVFIKDPESGEFRGVAMMGLVPGENLFYNPEKWQAEYVPNVIRLHPWGLQQSEKTPKELSLSLDMDSALVGEEEGTDLYDSEGADSEYLKNVKDFVGNVHGQTPVTIAFVKCMDELGILSPKSLSVSLGEDAQPLNIEGIYAVNPEALDKLSDEVYLDLRKRNYLPVIYAHLASLSQIGKLARRKANAEGMSNT
mgnify:CR=1 FL=1